MSGFVVLDVLALVLTYMKISLVCFINSREASKLLFNQIYNLFLIKKNEPIILLIGSNQTKTIMKKPKLTLNQLRKRKDSNLY